MRRLKLIAFASFFALAAPFFAHAQTPATPPGTSPVAVSTTEQVASFGSDITVNKDGTVLVTEHIDYDFPTPKHGIYRTIPLLYKMSDGSELYVPIDVISVTGAKYTVQKSHDSLTIKLGDPNRLVSGRQSYVITYKASGALRYDQPDQKDPAQHHDELYWNVTGPSWSVPIARVSAVVHLPDGVDGSSITSTCYTGDLGSKAQDCLYQTLGRDVHFAANDKLSVVVGWKPTGLVAHLAPKKPFFPDWVYNVFPIALIALLFGLAAAVWMARRWRKVGRDKGAPRALVVQYDPPDRLRPAEVGVITDERADHRDISATIVDLAVRGYLKIVELPKKMLHAADFELVKLKDADDALRPFEKRIMQVMFADGAEKATTSALTTAHAFFLAMTDITGDLYDDAVVRGYFAARPDKVRQRYRGAGVLLFFGSVLLISIIGNLFFPIGAGVSVGVGVAGVVVMVFASHMAGKTEKGTAAYQYAMGFREYLARAEKYRLEWQEKEHVFERFLPYAMAFGVVDKWSKAFKDMELPAPQWYQGASGSFAGGFNAAAFGTSMSSLGSSVRSASASPRTSSGSGFGGGGFSGGGFGGGGGGSW